MVTVSNLVFPTYEAYFFNILCGGCVCVCVCVCVFVFRILVYILAYNYDITAYTVHTSAGKQKLTLITSYFIST